MPITNSVSLLIPPSVKVFVESMSNGAFVQTVTLTPPSGTAAVFKGSGEGNVHMKLVTQGFLTAAPSGGQPSFTSPAAGGSYKVTIDNQQGPSKVTGGKLAVQNPAGGDFGLLWAISEDGADQDYNDAVVIFTYFSASAPI